MNLNSEIKQAIAFLGILLACSVSCSSQSNSVNPDGYIDLQALKRAQQARMNEVCPKPKNSRRDQSICGESSRCEVYTPAGTDPTKLRKCHER